MNLFTSDGRRLQAVESGTAYASPDGRLVNVVSNMGVLFSDGFGGAAVDTTKWDVYDGGLGAVAQSTGPQTAIGSGVTGITDSVANSALTVAMGVTNGAERWYLGRQIFAGAEDMTVILSRSQALAANSFFVGLVEVDIATGYPILNPNLAADFTNRGGVDFGKTTNTQTAFLEAVEDSSGAVASATGNNWSPTAMTTTFETLIEFHAEDIIASTCAIDAAGARTATVYRVSSQCPNDGKAYKLLVRARNISAPGSNTNFVIQRILVVDNQEVRIGVNSSGSVSPQQGLPTNLSGQGTAAGMVQGPVASAASGAANPFLAGVQALSANPTAGTTARVMNAMGRLDGAQIVQPLGIPQAHDLNRVTVSTTVETSLIASVASNRHMVETLTVANRDTAAATVDFRDATAGTVRLSVIVPAGDTRHLDFPAGYAAVAANTSWTAQLRAATAANAVEISSSSYRTTA